MIVHCSIEKKKKKDEIIIIIICVCISSVKAFYVMILCTNSLFFTSYVRVTKKRERIVQPTHRIKKSLCVIDGGRKKKKMNR
jgi:hypothetical protein